MERGTIESVVTALFRFKIINPKNRLAVTTRGSPSLVNGARLRTSSLRGSWVRIPPPALNLQIVRRGGGIPIRKTVALQFLIDAVTFLPKLL